MRIAPDPSAEPSPEPDAGALEVSEICERVASTARREAQSLDARRFFAMVARARGRDRRAPRRTWGRAWAEIDLEAGAALASELAPAVSEPWARDGIDRGLQLFATCVDETGRRCVATLVAEYIAWREPPDRFFFRCAQLLARRSATELVRLALVTSGYARMSRPSEDEARLLAAVPHRSTSPGDDGRLAVLAFAGEPPEERQRHATEIPSLGSDPVIAAFARAEFGWPAEPGPARVPLVGRPLLWFPCDLDSELRRLHLLFAAAIA
ncbi:hypothetical protein G6O69_36705 [Pseudenhygromyxa sp. WMMC2535]|uniref:hypothetical protein n=1 Tax=Pseudenhygromyxa sp. WMMC2535 TaxID=2712867 RepID=UPI001553BAB9|nr:hypothetical protein [Pseudenhygromyxa sp. WMMC2535]NVB36236.1 hypothetical protein [Pseudenhygromyxa sp. WMMC2535]NVB43424.1 hypothetical protein [Pseudenhygromyxa sp. WMMC2535]